MRTWTCQRIAGGVKCGAKNATRKRKCGRCGKPRQRRSPPAHMRALDESYATYIELNGGEFCGICGATPTRRRLDRDHCHTTGKSRGLLCWACNRQLRTWATVAWLRAAADYLERHETRTTGVRRAEP